MRTADRPLSLPGGRVANQKSVSLDSNSIRRGVRGSRGRSLSCSQPNQPVANSGPSARYGHEHRATDTSDSSFFFPLPNIRRGGVGGEPPCGSKGHGVGMLTKKNLPLQAKRYVNERDNTHPPLLSSDRSLPTTHQPPLPGA